MEYALTYFIIGLLIVPWVLAFWGAFARWRVHGRRLRRMQLEGSGLILIALFSRWVVLDRNFGLDRYGVENWSYWFSRGEVGLYFIGLLLFLLGFLLTRRPHLRPRPWPWSARLASWLGIFAGCALALVAWLGVTLPFMGLPWGLSRCLFMLGWVPFAVCYWYLRALDAHPPVPED